MWKQRHYNFWAIWKASNSGHLIHAIGTPIAFKYLLLVIFFLVKNNFTSYNLLMNQFSLVICDFCVFVCVYVCSRVSCLWPWQTKAPCYRGLSACVRVFEQVWSFPPGRIPTIATAKPPQLTKISFRLPAAAPGADIITWLRIRHDLSHLCESGFSGNTRSLHEVKEAR